METVRWTRFAGRLRRSPAPPPSSSGMRFAAVTSGTEAMGEVTVQLEDGGRKVVGRGASTDVIEASAKAYIDGLNKLASLGSGVPGAPPAGKNRAAKPVGSRANAPPMPSINSPSCRKGTGPPRDWGKRGGGTTPEGKKAEAKPPGASHPPEKGAGRRPAVYAGGSGGGGRGSGRGVGGTGPSTAVLGGGGLAGAGWGGGGGPGGVGAFLAGSLLHRPSFTAFWPALSWRGLLCRSLLCGFLYGFLCDFLCH